MNDAQSTVVGLKAQECPGGGWTGQPAELERATVADCLAHGVCGCIYGDAVQHIERMRSAWMFRLQLENECQGALHSRWKCRRTSRTNAVKRIARKR